jgi:hypothetical protein
LQGTVRWDTEVLGWRRLGLRIQEALGQGAAAQPQGEAVDPTVVAGWLGIAPDGYLECRPRGGGGGIALVLAPAWLLVTAALVAFYRPFFAGVLSGDAPRGMRVGMLLFTTAHASIFFGTFSGGLLLTILRALRPRHGIRADVAGLHVRGLFGWRFHAWDDIASVVMQDGRWQVAAGDDELVIEPSWQNASPLVRALQQALAARRDGRALPRGGPIPDAALSLARDRGEEAQAERGLSVADG